MGCVDAGADAGAPSLPCPCGVVRDLAWAMTSAAACRACMRPRGLTAMISELNRISGGTANSKIFGSRLSSSAAPAMPPTAPMLT